MKESIPAGAASGTPKIHTPEEIARQAGGISVKALADLIRHNGLETTTLGYTEPSPKGGRPRRLWGMTDAQLAALIAVRKPRIDAPPPN